MKKLNLGSGLDYKKEWINLDKNKDYNPDIIWDLKKFPLPFKNNQFEKIYCSHIIEHFEDPLKLLEELWRIAKNNGKIIIKVPHKSSILSWDDLTHKKWFTLNSFRYIEEGRDNYYFQKAKFKVIKKRYNYSKRKDLKGKIRNFLTFYANSNKWFAENIMARFISLGELYFELKIIK